MRAHADTDNSLAVPPTNDPSTGPSSAVRPQSSGLQGAPADISAASTVAPDFVPLLPADSGPVPPRSPRVQGGGVHLPSARPTTAREPAHPDRALRLADAERPGAVDSMSIAPSDQTTPIQAARSSGRRQSVEAARFDPGARAPAMHRVHGPPPGEERPAGVRPNRHAGLPREVQPGRQSHPAETAPGARRPQAVPPAERTAPDLAAQRPTASEELTIRVTIGRIDVRTVMPAAPPQPAVKPARPRPLLSLDDYLKQRNGRQR